MKLTWRAGFAALAAASVLVAGCGDGGGGGEAARTNTYWPMETGNRWVTDDGGDSTVTGTSTQAGETWFVLRDAGLSPPEDTYLQSDANGVRIYAAGSQFLPAYTYTLLKMPASTGDRHPAYRLTAPWSDVDQNGTADDIDYRGDAEVIGRETVTTPAGTFTDALHLRITYTGDYILRPSGTRQPFVSGTTDMWFAPGVGPVKMSDTSTQGGQTDAYGSQLTGYRVGTRTGGTLPAR